MAGKRINSEAPLTAAAKQKRYRDKTKDEKRERTKKIISQMGEEMREMLHGYIDGLSYGKLWDLCYMIVNPGNSIVTLEELSEMVGIPEYELKALERKGVIKKEKDQNPFSGYDELFTA